MYHPATFRLVERRFVDFFNNQPETEMGYCVATAFLKDGRIFKQVIVDGGCVTQVRGHTSVPFNESDVDHFVVTHDKWKW